MTVNEQAWLPELVYVDGEFRSDVALVSDGEGKIVRLAPTGEVERQAEAYRTFSNLGFPMRQHPQ